MAEAHQRFLHPAASGALHDGLCRHAIELGCFELVDSLPALADGGSALTMSEVRPARSALREMIDLMEPAVPRMG